MPSAASARADVERRSREWSATSSRTRVADRLRAARRPSGRRASGATLPASTCWRRPATRTWKNSSRLPAKIARNLTRSSSGLRSSRASYRTRALNSSQDSSRLMYGSGASARRAARRARRTCGSRDGSGFDGGHAVRLCLSGGYRVGDRADHGPARIARAFDQSAHDDHRSARYRRSPDAGSTQTRIVTPVVGSTKRSVVGLEARLERLVERLAAAGPGRLRPLRRPRSGSAVARAGSPR